MAEWEYKKYECWWKSGVVGDMDVSGGATVYGGMDVVGDTDIRGNVMLTSGLSGAAGVAGNDGVQPVQLWGVAVLAGVTHGNVNVGGIRQGMPRLQPRRVWSQQ
jgi:hypothetical protein